MNITKSEKLELVEALVRNKQAPAAELMRVQIFNMLADVYANAYSVDEQVFMGNLPVGWLPVSSQVTLREGDSSLIIGWNGKRRYLRYADIYTNDVPSVSRLMTFQDTMSGLPGPVTKIKNMLVDFEDETEKLKEQVRRALMPYRTLDKLVDDWPAVKPFLVKRQEVYKLPVPQFGELNKALGLPIEEKA